MSGCRMAVSTSVATALRDAQPTGVRLSQPQLKDAFRDQYLLLMMDQGRAVRALPGLLPADVALREQALAAIRSVLSASGRLSEEGARRLGEVVAMFAVSPPPATQPAGRRERRLGS